MDGERWARIQELFHEALNLPEAERRGFLEGATADDPTLVEDVLALVAADARRTSLLDRGLADAAQAVLDPSVPAVSRIGPYRIIRPIGQGGMGVVYLGERDDLGSRAAIKLLRDASLSPARRERFRSEQRTLAQLDHPFVARLHDADTLPDGTPYFVMEYVEGESLTAHATSRDLTIPQRLRLFRDVCEAVQYAHRHAIVHRDLKPSNIMVRSDGVVKLLDFGIAKQLENLDVEAEQTQTALRLMTPAYAAPEQILGQPVGTYTDVYALGVILYELLAGRVPFDVSRLTPARAEARLLEEPLRPSAAAAETGRLGAATRSEWADLDVLCLTAMHRDVQRRYRTVDALLRDVDNFLGREPLDAHPDSAAYRASRFLRRNWRTVTGTAAAVALLVGVSGWYAVRLAWARDAALVEAARAQRVQAFVVDLFQGSDDTVGPADSLRVVTLLERGVRETQLLDGEPRAQADMYETLGTVYRQLGNLPRADSLLQLALERRVLLFGAEHTDVAASLVALAELRAEQAEHEEAERLLHTAAAMSRRHVGATHPLTIRATTALGHVLQQRGRYEEAIVTLDEAFSAQPGTESPEVAALLAQLANTHYFAGDYPRADSLNRRVLAMNTRLHGERHPAVAQDLINIGAVQSELGRPQETERLYRDALAINEAFYGTDHPKVASNLTVLARVLLQQQRVDEASELLEKAMAVRERVYGPVHPSVASTANELGTAAQFREDYPAAEAWFRRMASIYEQTLEQPHYLTGIALSNLAGVHYDADDVARAEQVMTPAVAIFMETLGPDHSTTATGRVKLGRMLHRLGRHAAGEAHLLAAYASLSGQLDPGAQWLQIARRYLAELYEETGRAEAAVRWREEFAANDRR